MERFPTLQSLAQASLDEVLPWWSGLGYYHRIRNLHAAAQVVSALHGGCVPRDASELLSLPGVGRYTAGAILSLAYELPKPVVDGNVMRVLCRVTAMTQDPRRAQNLKKLWSLAESMVVGDSPGDFNQALMELGATVCLPGRPQCQLCPVRDLCQSHLRGLADRIPRKTPARRSETHFMAMVLVEGSSGRLLIMKRNHPTLMTGLWEFPMVDCAELAQGDPKEVSSRFKSELGLHLTGMEQIGQIRHAITYRRIRLQVYAGRLRGSIPPALRSHCNARWMKPADQPSFGMSSLSMKAMRLLEEKVGTGKK
jgi:A/G-specific adenine glycosylase